MCLKYSHLQCAEAGRMSIDLLTTIKGIKHVHYICKICGPDGIKSKLVPEDPNEDSHRATHNALRLSEEVTRLKNLNTQLLLDQAKAAEEVAKASEIFK